MEKKWVPMKASKDNVEVSHLFFADDLMLFAKANEAGAKTIKEVLSKFCAESGQLISIEKSRVYFSPNIHEDIKDRICTALGIQATTCLGKYLGMPLKHKGAAKSQYNYIAKRMLSKLAGWKARFLSFAGRCVLVKSVLTSIPNYVMQGVVLPVHLCEKIDQISRDFLWGSSVEKKKLHLVGWSKIIMPKEEGGLSIQQSRAKNIALLAKLNWRLYHEKDALWMKIILNKYCSWTRRISKDPDKLPCSSVWTTIKAGFSVLKKGLVGMLALIQSFNFGEVNG